MKNTLSKLGLILILCGFLASCGNTKKITWQQKYTHDYLTQAVLWQQNSAEYRALCYQAFNSAKLAVDAYLAEHEGEHEKLAIVTDIDETVLDNSPFEAEVIRKDMDFSDKEWFKWTEQAKAKAIPGATEFLNYAHTKGIEIFYVTNRQEPERKATLENMKAVNFPNADDAHLLLKTNTSAKTGRFEQVAKNHEIVLFMGDNLSDFSSEFRAPSTKKRNALADEMEKQFGYKFIVLPNPMYGDWETQGIFEGKYDWTPAQKDSIQRANLKYY